MTGRFAFDPRTDDARPLAVLLEESARRQGLLPAEPELTDDYLARCTVCPACRLYYPINDECPAPPRHCVA